ncbi:hypothetical protein MTR_7g109650 [Medicago truncatula]|uniref:Uncharacterized protein n=1 Tax=Medicago truncatula TaxID=3880 RepID=G7KTM0_MEDTR|nr:hypothetical protein MTR_7g109650 [Medicago truncatula]
MSKMVSESLQDPLGHLLSGFHNRVTHHLCLRTKPNNTGRFGRFFYIVSRFTVVGFT